ncbi:MerR family transcriptional regulator [Cellulomonas sp. zg-ZUI199]|uniref:MerR family transcriptional regulator n=1 Tax=Cellulomonas wangleii TaxID=2816956 RepID=A0ABX8D5T5_9CELL|nr:MerR family transcriptional regulator [Cellulomonas wangleii]MBO0926274.1 MerR family transcriptional regulator [Cellulomonas wangleii]QVI62779.1 MerR family transcriptional regulator [Cellulomonas wangleii]
MASYRISQLAERSGVPATTLRFYDDAGLLPAQRTAAGYRIYDDTAVEQLAFISSAKFLGLALGEIRELLIARQDEPCRTVRSRLVAGLETQLTATGTRIDELTTFAARLSEVRAELLQAAPAGGCGPDCGCTTGAAAASVPEDLPAAIPLSVSPPTTGTGTRQDAPVACALDPSDLVARTDQWHSLLEHARRREDVDGGVRITFPADADLAGRVATLAAAEQSCCAFLDFTLHLEPGRLELTVRAPEAGTAMVTDLFGGDF